MANYLKEFGYHTDYNTYITGNDKLLSWAFFDNASTRKIYVPAESVNTYKTASGWSNYANDIEAIPSN